MDTDRSARKAGLSALAALGAVWLTCVGCSGEPIVNAPDTGQQSVGATPHDSTLTGGTTSSTVPAGAAEHVSRTSAQGAPERTTGSSPIPRVQSCNGSAPEIEPNNVILDCGDAGRVVLDIRWDKWGPSGANGRGVKSTKTCDPVCAAPGRVREDVTLSLGDLNSDGLFQTLSIRVTRTGATETWPMQPKGNCATNPHCPPRP